ncbi:MAG: DUF4254 domain-containing protein [SAR324 cluster bacterium]|nr:DUF4254 domain-containing protein [SAR324 cluster bacterium]
MDQVNLWHRESPDDVNQFSSAESAKQFFEKVTLQHKTNYMLWHQEDLARDDEATDQQIAAVKRRIDQLNQQRNNLIEELDEAILIELRSKNIKQSHDAAMNSETPGSVIDRLSINALKIYHMHEESIREDAGAEHRRASFEKVEILNEQRRDLGNCLEVLMEDLIQGKKILKVYRQLKMYNDPTLNPVLYKKNK